jgi:hypothetical protein
MTQAQIGWAASHDWFIRSEPSLALPGSLVAVVRDSEAESRQSTERRFVLVGDLRRWAGY